MGKKLSRHKQKQLIMLFVAGATARTSGELVNVHRNTATRYFRRIREKIAEQPQTPPLMGQVEIDESYFGGMRKGRRGRGCSKIPVLGMIARNGKVAATVIPNAGADVIIPIIRENVVTGSTIYTDKWRGYRPLARCGYEHLTICHARHFALGHIHVNSIENFWSQAKRHLRRFNGIPPQTFPLFLAECVWRFNNPSPRRQIAIIRNLLL